MFKSHRLLENLKSRPSVKVDERTAYMVNPSDYGAPHSAFLKWRDVTKTLKVSPKATPAQQNEFKRLKKQFDDAMGELEDAVAMMGDTEEVQTSEVAPGSPK